MLSRHLWRWSEATLTTSCGIIWPSSHAVRSLFRSRFNVEAPFFDIDSNHFNLNEHLVAKSRAEAEVSCVG